MKKFWIAVDDGLIINPDCMRNQIEGGAIQAVSFNHKEAVRFDRSRISSDAWEHYPILKFSEVLEVDIALVSRPC